MTVRSKVNIFVGIITVLVTILTALYSIAYINYSNIKNEDGLPVSIPLDDPLVPVVSPWPTEPIHSQNQPSAEQEQLN